MHMAFLAVFAVVCLFSLFAPYSLEPRFGAGVSSPVSHAEIYRNNNWAKEILRQIFLFLNLPSLSLAVLRARGLPYGRVYSS